MYTTFVPLCKLIVYTNYRHSVYYKNTLVWNVTVYMVLVYWGVYQMTHAYVYHKYSGCRFIVLPVKRGNCFITPFWPWTESRQYIAVHIKRRRLMGPKISLNWVNVLAERFAPCGELTYHLPTRSHSWTRSTSSHQGQVIIAWPNCSAFQAPPLEDLFGRSARYERRMLRRRHSESGQLNTKDMGKIQTGGRRRWFSAVLSKGLRISGPILKTKAEEFAKKLGRPDFVATDGWLGIGSSLNAPTERRVATCADLIYNRACASFKQTTLDRFFPS